MKKLIITISSISIGIAATALLWFGAPIFRRFSKVKPFLNIQKLAHSSSPNQLKTMPFSIGFTTLNTKSKNKELKIEGKMPKWLSGTLLRVGPGKFEIENNGTENNDNSQAGHWLDGFSMAHRFKINKGKVTYSNKLLKSHYYKKAKKTGVLEPPQLNKGKSFLGRFASAFSTPKQLYDNVNVNILKYGDHCVAVTETPTPLAFDPDTLKTIKSVKFKDKLGGHFCCAHPHFDEEKQQWYNFFITYGNTSSYTIYTMDKKSITRKKLGSVSVKRPAYIHSFAMTNKYIILTESPFTLKPMDLLFGEKTFLEYFKWEPEKGTRFIVIDKNTGKKIGEYKTEAFFSLHHINAFDNGTTITLDIPTYQDASVINAYRLNKLCGKKNCTFPRAKFERFAINLENKKVERSTISEENIEMPRINEKCDGCTYRYAYGTSHKNPQSFADSIIKVDANKKSHCNWYQDGCYTTEPIFVAKPGAKNEDDGVLLSVVLDAHKQHSFLLVLDAKTMKELARAPVEHHIPFTMHGQFYKS